MMSLRKKITIAHFVIVYSSINDIYNTTSCTCTNQKKKRNISVYNVALFYKSLQSLYRHMTLHTGEADLKRNLPCDYCEKRFKCKEELKLHTRTHTGEKPFPCDKCSYRAAACCNLQKHIQRRHENVNKIDGRRNNGRKKKEVKTEEENDRKLEIKNERGDI